ncbi:MAG TPA: hypothetical protein VOA64_04565 [Candidatus Dormibacteraeota bacterium]|nr:hypothetical protein [Candidatus Dormibacteraeota bacterium]
MIASILGTLPGTAGKRGRKHERSNLVQMEKILELAGGESHRNNLTFVA